VGYSGHKALGYKGQIEDTGLQVLMFRSCRCEAAVDSRGAAGWDLGMRAPGRVGNRRFVVVHTGQVVADYTGHTVAAAARTEAVLRTGVLVAVLHSLAVAVVDIGPEVDLADSSGRIGAVHSPKALAGRTGIDCRNQTL